MITMIDLVKNSKELGLKDWAEESQDQLVGVDSLTVLKLKYQWDHDNNYSAFHLNIYLFFSFFPKTICVRVFFMFFFCKLLICMWRVGGCRNCNNALMDTFVYLHLIVGGKVSQYPKRKNHHPFNERNHVARLRDGNHLEGDICVRHRVLGIKIFQEKFYIGAALPPVTTWWSSLLSYSYFLR